MADTPSWLTEYPEAENKNWLEQYPEAKDEPFFDLSDTLSAAGQAVAGLPTTAPHAFRQLYEGLENPWKRGEGYLKSQEASDAYQQELEAANLEAEKSGDISTMSRGMRQAGQSLGFSAGAMGAGLVASTPSAAAGRTIGGLAGPEGAVAGEIIGRGAGALASGYGAAYRMAGAQFLDDARKEIDARFLEVTGELPNEQQQEEAYQELLPLAQAFGHAEAGPEAIGNLAMAGAGKYVFGLGRETIEKLAASALGKTGAAAGALGTELAGETITGVEQNRIEEQKQALLRGEQPEEGAPRTMEDYLTSFKEVAPATLATMGLMSAAPATVKAASMLRGEKPQPAPADDFAQRAAMEGATEYRAPEVKVNGVTIATIPEGSDMTPEDVLDFANSPEDMAMLARNGKIVLPEVVAPIEGVDPAITDEMNERLAASAAIAPQTVEALKAAQVADIAAETAAPEVGISTEWGYTALDNQGKELRGTMRAATQADAIAELRQQGLYPTHVNATTAAASPAQDAVDVSRNTDLFPDRTDFMGKLSQEATLSNYQERDGFGVAEYVNPATGTTDVYVAAFGDNDFIAYIRVYDENGKPTNRFTSKLERRTEAPGVTKKMLSDLQSRLPAGHEYTEDVSVSTDGLKFIAGQLRQGYEVVLDENGRPLTQDVAVSGESIVNDLPIAVDPNGKFENIRITNRAEFDKVRPVLGKMLESFGVGLGAQNVRWENGTAFIDIPVLRRKPAAPTPAAESLGVTPPPAPTLEAPEGAARNTDMLRQAAARAAGTEQGPPIGFIQSPSAAVTAETETPSSTANAAGGSQSVQTEPAEGSIPAVTEDTVSISDIPSTAEIPVTPQGEAPTTATEGQPMPGGSSEWSPTVGQPATATINGQKIVGTVGPSTGKGLVSFQYEWNGKPQKATVRPDRLESPVASLTDPPKYQYTQEQNSRKAGKHFPITLGVHANHDFRKSFASMAEDTSLSETYRQMAKVLSTMPAFANVDFHVIADGRKNYAGEYSFFDGKAAILVNLRQVGRGKVDALGTILHEALHHVTLAKVLNPQGAFEIEVVGKLDKIRERVAEYAKQQGISEKAIGYEIDTLEEFISALTRPDFQRFLASIPDSFAPGVAVGKYRSVLSEVFRHIAELLFKKPVPKGSTLEQYTTTILALFETPHRTIPLKPLSYLRAQSKPGYRTPAEMLAEAAEKAKGERAAEKPQGLASMFKPQAKRPATGERKLLDMPVRDTITDAYREAVRGSSTQMAPLSAVYAQARLLQPGLTPEAFLAQVQEGYDNGTLLLEGAGSQQEADAASMGLHGTPVGTAVRMMPAPETPKSLVDEETDAAYMAAVEAGDMETAQRMVDEAAGGFASMEEQEPRDFSYGDENDQFFYHVTTKDRLENVVYEGEGLIPNKGGQFAGAAAQSNSRGKVFFTERSGVKVWMDEVENQLEHSREYDEDLSAEDDLAVIRIPKHLVLDKQDDDPRNSPVQVGRDFYTTKPIPSFPEAVVRDEAGNVIPLSQRFNPESNSILYAAPIDISTLPTREPAPETPKSLVDEETDAAYMAAVEAGDMETAQRMVDEAAKAAGYTVGPWLHGTKKRFTEFKPASKSKSLEMFSFGHHFTDSPELASQYGDNVMQAFLKYENGLDAEVVVDKNSRLGQWLKSINPKIMWFPDQGREVVYLRNALDELPPKKLEAELRKAGYDALKYRAKFQERGVGYMKNIAEGDAVVVFFPNQIKSADPVTYDEAGNVIPLSRRFNPESNSILYAAPIDISTLPTREPASGENVPDREAGSSENAETVSQRLESRRKEAISSAVAENDWGNYTREQKVAAAESFLAKWVASFSAMEFPADVRFSVEVGDGSGAHVSVHEVPSRPLGIRVSVGQNRGLDKYANLSPTEVFAHLYDTAQEESIHVAQYLGMHRDWLEAREQGFKDTFLSYIGQKLKDTFDQINKARIDLQQTDSAAAEKIKDAMLASWNIYHFNDRVEGIAGLWSRLEGDPSRQGDFIMEMVRQLTQLKRQDFTTETGWQKFQRVLKQWITDAINSLRGVQDVFRSGMAGDLIQRQLADLEAALEGKPLPSVSRGPVASLAEEGGEPPTIDIGGEAEPADGKGKQLYQKKPTAIGSTYISPADITLQEKKTQQETLDAARKIIGEEIAKHPNNTVAGRRAALDRFRLDTSLSPEVRAVGTGVIAQQADRMANLSEGNDQLLLDEMADEAAKLSGIMSSDLESWRNLKADANLQIDKMAEEAGRTLNIFNVFRRLTPEGFLRRMTRKYNDAVREKMGQNFDVPAGEVEAEIMRLWKMMQEAGATARGEAIAAALKAFMPRRVNTRKIIESLFPQAGTRDRMSKGGEALVRSFFQMMAGPRDQKGPLAEFDKTIQTALSDMLRKVMQDNGLVAENQSVQMTDIDKMVRSVSADELRFDKIAAVDEAMQKELDAIEDPERRAVLQQAWEEATAKMYTNIASDATVRRALNAELKSANVDWTKMFDSNQKPDAIKAKTVDAVMAKIEALLTDSTDPAVRANLGMLRGEVEAAFDFIAANKRTKWLAQREAIEARRRVAEHRAAFMEALRNQGVAEQAINRISEKLAGPQRGKPDQNPVSALVGEHMKAPVADFVDKLVALDVDRATAESLDKAASTLRSEVAAAEKLKTAERAVAQLMKSLKPKPRAPREKIEKALKTLFTADTVGALDDQAFFDAFGEAFGMPPLSDEQQTRIKKLIREVNALPKGPARLDKQQDLDEELALWKGIAARDVLLSAWYANILSGVSTQGMGLLGNLLNFVPRSLFNMINNPRSAGAYFKGAFGEGLSTGLKEAKAAMAGRGLYKVSKYGDKSLVSALELLRKKGPSTLPEWVAYIASGGTRLRYVFRIMQAIDALAWNTAREGHAYLAAHRALLEQEKESGTKRSPEEFSRAFIDSLGGDVAQIEEDLRAARQALIDAGQTPSLLTVDRMAREARNLRREAGGVKAGNRFADRIVLQQDPEGSGKFISNLIDVFQKKDILGLPIGQLLIPFNRIVSNLFEQSLDYTPVGLVRAFLGGHLSDVKPGSFWNGKVEFKDKSQLFDQMERRERAMAAVTGMAAAAIIYALASAHEDEPDEDVPFMVYGWGPESKNKRAQMPKGWVPYSIKIGDNYIKFSEMPFGMMFAAAGSAMDAMRYKNMDKKTSTQRLAYVLKTAAKGFLNQGVMSSLDTAMETLMFDASEKKMADIPVNALKGLVPAQGMLRDISTIMDPNKVSNDSLTSALLRDIPFAKSWGTKPDLNVFGEPIKLDGYPITRRIVTHREPHAIADYLGRNGLNIPGMEQTIEIGKYLPDKAKDRIQSRALELGAMENGLFTPEQNYAFKKRAGELTKAAVESIMQQSPKIETEKQRENIQSAINKRVEAARRRAMLEAVPVK